MKKKTSQQKPKQTTNQKEGLNVQIITDILILICLNQLIYGPLLLIFEMIHCGGAKPGHPFKH